MKSTSKSKHKLLKSGRYLLTVLICFFMLPGISQNFTWVNGSNGLSAIGIYGSLGVPANNNNPGARTDGAEWTDANGNLWLFGGYGHDASNGFPNYLGDLWKYDPAGNKWAWMGGPSSSTLPAPAGVYGTQGTAAAANRPGHRKGSVTWTDASGNLWLFGGEGYDGSGSFGLLNDLWKYNISSGQWTWMKGSSNNGSSAVYGSQGTAAAANTPGGRTESVSWNDGSGNLWLLGGRTSSVQCNNDLWRYNIANNQWTWMKGSNLADQAGVYGSQFVPAAANTPGARSKSVSWVATGYLWLYGGEGFDDQPSFGLMGDLWRYSLSNNQWTWMSGQTVEGMPGFYGTINVPNSMNTPGGRHSALGWPGNNGNIYLFGGFGFADGLSSVTPTGEMNDLWVFDVSTNIWTWVKGSSTTNQPGNYGSLGVTLASNQPGSRSRAMGWAVSNQLWLFGGNGYASNTSGLLGDLWGLAPCTGQSLSVTPLPALSSTSLCPGRLVTITASGASTYSWSNGATGGTITVSPLVTTVYSVVSTDPQGCGNSAALTISVSPITTFSVASSHSIICAGKPFSLTATGAVSYSWSTGQQTSVVTLTANSSSVYSVSAVNIYSCSSTKTISQQVATCTGILDTEINDERHIKIFPNPSNGFINVTTNMTGSLEILIRNLLGQAVHQQTLDGYETLIQLNLEKGIYTFEVKGEEKIIRSGKLCVE